MNANIIEALKAEHADLLRKAAAIRSTLTVYGVDEQQLQREQSATPVTTVTRIVPEPASRTRVSAVTRASDYGQTIRKIARELIESRGNEPTPTRDIVNAIKARGIKITGRNELNATSALLSRSADFQSIPQKGWVVGQLSLGHAPQPNENGALNGSAAGAPETGRAATLPIENRISFS